MGRILFHEMSQESGVWSLESKRKAVAAFGLLTPDLISYLYSLL
jgi:hypothetical protein